MRFVSCVLFIPIQLDVNIIAVVLVITSNSRAFMSHSNMRINCEYRVSDRRHGYVKKMYAHFDRYRVNKCV